MVPGIKIKTGWNFDNSYSSLPEVFYVRMEPTPVRSPKLVRLNQSLAEYLGLDPEELKTDEGAAVFAGNRIPEGAEPLAQAYAGHQFGHFTMLGDGRAILLGEQIAPKGERYDIQLKGSGRTAFSRGGDGRATLGPMLREYIISEAMYALGIPTTRSLAVVTTGETVRRQTNLPGAILTRVAASHIRVGTFQYIAKWGTRKELQTLADYTLKRHFPHFEHTDSPYLYLLQEVIKRQAALIAKWQLVGFIHGVMNTDNMTISGETIDYGPCAFMDVYDRTTVFSSIDLRGRYAYGNQPDIGSWNLTRFAETLLPLLHDNQSKAIEIAQEALSAYPDLFDCNWISGMRAKLGLFHEEKEDEVLIDGLLQLMQDYRTDYTNTFTALSFDTALHELPAFKPWYERWQARLNRQPEGKSESQVLMRKSNPAVIPRNHRVEAALKAAVEQQDFHVMDQLLSILANPYAHSPEQAEYAALPENTGLPYRTFCGT